MAEFKTTDYLSPEEEMPATLPTGLNVLTILTFIGCGFALLGGVWSFIKAEDSYKQMQQAQGNLDAMPGWAKGMMGPEMLEMSRKSLENRVPILLLTLVGAGLCLWGAIEMRKLKKQGFILWAAGEFLPLIATVVFIGSGVFSGLALIGLAFPVIFLILYGVHRKYLVY